MDLCVKLDISVGKICNVLAFFFLTQELREAVANIEPKHEKEIDELIKSYKSLYQEWVIELRFFFIFIFVVALCNADSTCLYMLVKALF